MQQAKTFEDVQQILANVAYKQGWHLRVIEKRSDVVLCQWLFSAPDINDGGIPVLQSCRKWFVSLYSTDSEVIRTAYLAVVQAEMHELNENFTYKGARLFDPHTDLDALAGYMGGAVQDVRK